MEIDRPGLTIDHLPARPRLANRCQRFFARQMHEIDWRFSIAGHRDRALHSQALGQARSGVGEVAHAQLPGGGELLAQIGNQALVLGVNIGEGTKPAGLSDDFEILRRQLIEAGHADHKEFKARVAVGNCISHLGHDLRRRFEDCRVQAVVDHRLSLGFFLPSLDTPLNRLSRLGQRVVYNRCHSSACCGNSAGMEIIG